MNAINDLPKPVSVPNGYALLGVGDGEVLLRSTTHAGPNVALYKAGLR